MPMIKALVLDIGGILVRTEDRTGRNKLEKKYNLSRGEVEQLVFNSLPARASTIGKADQDAIWNSVARELSLSASELEEFQRLFWEGDRIDLDLLQFLHEARSHYITALLSNAWLDHRKVLEDKFKIMEGQTADYILISSELGVEKPDPHIYQILADTIKCGYDEILFVDDFIQNIEAAKTLGIHTIYYQPGMNLINEIKSRLDKIQ